MKKCGFILLCITVSVMSANAQSSTPDDAGTTINAGKSAALGVEASTAFAMDMNDYSTGLETKAGIELIFDLFPAADRGIRPENADTPTVRLELKDAAFTWWNTFYTTGGNYEQDSFNKWTARPLVFSFDTFNADLLYKNYFFRIAGTTTVMRTDTVSLRSIFDDVMDVNDRWYYARSQALWRTERYNIQNFPLLQGRLNRNALDVDYRGNISGILAGGAEFDRLGFTLKAASNKNGKDNDDNAWLIGADFEAVPVENLKIEARGFASLNYDKTTVKKNPQTFGTAIEYRLPFSQQLILAPYAGFDFEYETSAQETFWEVGAGVLLYTRGFDTRISSRVLDWDDVIPAGYSLSFNINDSSRLNTVLSWFDPAGEESLVPNFGGFVQLEIANLLRQDNEDTDFAVLAQVEYSISGKVLPYIRGGYKPEFKKGSTTQTSGSRIISAAVGCYLTPIQFFSIDLRYEMNHRQTDTSFKIDNGLFSTVFTIRM